MRASVCCALRATMPVDTPAGDRGVWWLGDPLTRVEDGVLLSGAVSSYLEGKIQSSLPRGRQGESERVCGGSCVDGVGNRALFLRLVPA